MKEQDLGDLKMDRFIARTYHYLMVSLAVISTSAIAGSVPAVMTDALPVWADIALAGGGLLVAPGSIIEISTTKKWLREAERLVRECEERNKA